MLFCAGIAGGTGAAPGQPPPAVPAEPRPFTAMGNEPGWRLVIEGGRMTLNADHGATTLAVPAVEPVPIQGGRRYAGEEAGHSLEVTVLDGICHDTMTGMPRPFTVTIEFDGRTLDGCGGEPASLLRGGAWIVESIDGAPVLPDARPTVVFGDDGSVSGHASCNGYSGTYTLTGEGLAVTGLHSTMNGLPAAAAAAGGRVPRDPAGGDALRAPAGRLAGAARCLRPGDQSADGSGEFRATREGDLNLIRVGDGRDEIPDAVALGG